MFQEIGDNIWVIPSKDNGKYPYSNSLFINGTQTKLLIDTGVGRLTLKKFLKEFGEPDLILYSHGHEDHVAGNKLFPTAKKFIHPNDKLMATSQKELFRIYGLADDLQFQKFVESYFKSFQYQPLSEIKTFTDNQIYDLGDYKVQVLFLPGHSAGHCGFEILNESIIFASDIDLTSFGPWYGGLDCNICDFQNSIKILLKDPPHILITSHKGVFQQETLVNKLSQYLNKFEQRDEKILFALKEARTLDELVSQAIIYGRFPDPKEFFLSAERIMLSKHLDILIEQNRIEFHQDKYQRL